MDGNAPKPMMPARALWTFDSMSWRWAASDWVSEGATDRESESEPPFDNRSLICMADTDLSCRQTLWSLCSDVSFVI